MLGEKKGRPAHPGSETSFIHTTSPIFSLLAHGGGGDSTTAKSQRKSNSLGPEREWREGTPWDRGNNRTLFHPVAVDRYKRPMCCALPLFFQGRPPPPSSTPCPILPLPPLPLPPSTFLLRCTTKDEESSGWKREGRWAEMGLTKKQASKRRRPTPTSSPLPSANPSFPPFSSYLLQLCIFVLFLRRFSPFASGRKIDPLLSSLFFLLLCRDTSSHFFSPPACMKLKTKEFAQGRRRRKGGGGGRETEEDPVGRPLVSLSFFFRNALPSFPSSLLRRPASTEPNSPKGGRGGRERRRRPPLLRSSLVLGAGGGRGEKE